MKTTTAIFPLPPVQFMFAGFNWPRYVATLPRGNMATRLQRKKNPVTGPYYHAPKPISGRHPGRGFYLDSDGAPGLRWSWCDAVDGARIDHTGWFTDEDGTGDKIRGVVFRLPRGRGFLAGWSMGTGMASEIDGTIYDDETTAAYAADSEAESVAENERDYHANLDEGAA